MTNEPLVSRPFFRTRQAGSLPVLMYHYVNRHAGAITVSPEHFEEHCREMAENGWRGVGLDEAEAFLMRGESLPPKSVLITFDDGFLDNYVYAWPLLRRYGHKGVIFAVTERLLRETTVRPSLSDVWEGRISLRDLPPVNDVMRRRPSGYEMREDLFLSWEEARLMERSGTIAVAAHSARHLAVFAGREWSEVHRPGPRSNTFYRVDFPVPWGLPHFKERPALHSRAFVPSAELLQTVAGLVPRNTEQALAFFQDAEKTQALFARLRSLRPESLGSFESEEKRRERLAVELDMCRSTLERELGHPVHAFCWPWGGSSPQAEKAAREAGFQVFFRTSMGANRAGRPGGVHRFKVRDKGWPWLRLRLEIYSRPRLADLYAACRC